MRGADDFGGKEKKSVLASDSLPQLQRQEMQIIKIMGFLGRMQN